MNSIVVFVRFHFSSATTRKRLCSSIDFAIASRSVVFFLHSPRSSPLLFDALRGEHDGNLHSFCWVSGECDFSIIKRLERTVGKGIHWLNWRRRVDVSFFFFFFCSCKRFEIEMYGIEFENLVREIDCFRIFN